MDIDLIIRYLSQEVTTQEKNQLEKKLESSAEFRTQFQEINKIWESTDMIGEDFHPDVKKALKKVKAITRQERRIWRPIYSLSLASIMLLVFTFSILFSHNVYDTVFGTKTYVSNEGITRVELADKSTIWINEKSKIIISKNFYEEARQVELEGEAYFEIARDETRPFVIKCGGSETKVLGTSFNIHESPESNAVTLSVVSGKVAFYPDNQHDKRVFMAAGDVAQFIAQSQDIVKSHEPRNNHLSWKSRVFYFDNAPLADVFRDLSHGYGEVIHFDNRDIFHLPFSGNFNNMSFEDIIEIIEQTMDVHVEEKDGEFFVRKLIAK